MNMEGSDTMDSKGKKEEDEADKIKLRRFRSVVEKEDLSSKEVDDLTLRRFLIARDSNIKKASGMFLKFLQWRREFVPEGSVPEADVPNEIAHKKAFLQGQDKRGRPVAVVFGAKHFQNKNLEEFKRFVVYFLDKISARIPPEQGKFLAIGDIDGWGYSNCDIRGYIAALTILQDYYPERLGKLFIVHAPYIFMTAWRMVYPFIDERTKKKIVFVDNKRLKQTLLNEIDESQLPEIYGGKLPLVPIQDC